MSMTPEDKAIIAEYMGWGEYEDEYCRGMFPFDTIIHFDLNDAALCVVKMMEKGDWKEFHYSVATHQERLRVSFADITAWLFNADNFFQAMAAWLRGK